MSFSFIWTEDESQLIESDMKEGNQFIWSTGLMLFYDLQQTRWFLVNRIILKMYLKRTDQRNESSVYSSSWVHSAVLLLLRRLATDPLTHCWLWGVCWLWFSPLLSFCSTPVYKNGSVGASRMLHPSPLPPAAGVSMATARKAKAWGDFNASAILRTAAPPSLELPRPHPEPLHPPTHPPPGCGSHCHLWRRVEEGAGGDQTGVLCVCLAFLGVGRGLYRHPP